jgi:hypothetical protein
MIFKILVGFSNGCVLGMHNVKYYLSKMILLHILE